MSDYVLKPVSRTKLIEVLKEVVRKREESGIHLKYSKMDGLVTGLAEALWNQDKEAWQRTGKEARDSLSGLGSRSGNEILKE